MGGISSYFAIRTRETVSSPSLFHTVAKLNGFFVISSLLGLFGWLAEAMVVVVVVLLFYFVFVSS